MKIQPNHITYLKDLLCFFAMALLISLSSCDSSSNVKLIDLKCEYRINPLGIDNSAPRLSCKTIASGTNLGKNKEHLFNGITASKCRILILDSKQKPSISEFQIFNSKE